ncbi:HHIP protein 1 [Biomphalaria glabrata]|nr:HHIP protein 1 [Biomphalaria glabrata]
MFLATEKLVVMQLCALVLTLFPVSSTQVYDQAKMPAREQCYCLHKLTSDLRSPVSAVFYLEKGKERILVVEQRGLVKKLTRDGVVLDTFMDIRDRVVTSESYGDSRGLLSIVLDPYYDTSKKVYVYYIRKFLNEDYAYVSTFKVTESGRVDTNSEVFLLRIHQPFDGGNGGPMFFGDDGYLYIVTGDGGEKDDPKGNAQNK